jgi:hypothetical protein
MAQSLLVDGYDNCEYISNNFDFRTKYLSILPTSSFELIQGVQETVVQDDPELLGDSGEVLIFEWSGWRFNFRCVIFSPLHGK